MRIEGVNGKTDKDALKVIAWCMNDMMFLLADMLEAAMTESLDANERAGYRLKYEYKHYIKTALYNLKRFRSVTKKTNEQGQERLGIDSDSWLQFIWTITDRFPDSSEKLKEIYKQILNSPSHYCFDFSQEATSIFE